MNAWLWWWHIAHWSIGLSVSEIIPQNCTCLSFYMMCSLSVLTAILPGEPGLAGSIEAKKDWSGGDTWSYKSWKSPVKSSTSTNQHPTFYRPDALPVAQPTASEHWRESYAMCWSRKWPKWAHLSVCHNHPVSRSSQNCEDKWLWDKYASV